MAPMPKIDEARVMRGEEIAKLDGQITRLDGRTYQVRSQSDHGLYTVVWQRATVLSVVPAPTTSTEK